MTERFDFPPESKAVSLQGAICKTENKFCEVKFDFIKTIFTLLGKTQIHFVTYNDPLFIYFNAG